MSLDWLDRAACRAKPTSMFFVGGGEGAKSICAQCAVVAECLDEAARLAVELGEEPEGVWGGKTPAERARCRRRACASCGSPFTPKTKDGRFCSLCRMELDGWTLYKLAEARARAS